MSYDTSYGTAKTNTGTTGAGGTPDDRGDACSSIAKPVDAVMPRRSGRGRSTVAACMNLFQRGAETAVNFSSARSGQCAQRLARDCGTHGIYINNLHNFFLPIM